MATRIQNFCQEYTNLEQGLLFYVYEHERMKQSTLTKRLKIIMQNSNQLQSQLQEASLLPKCGHFLIDVVLALPTEVSGETMRDISVTMMLKCYCHSKHGAEIATKILSKLPGSVSRTSRRWRRRKNKVD